MIPRCSERPRRRSMPERLRAMQALAGRTFPRRGDVGHYYRGDQTADVIVTRLSGDGEYVTVRFLGRVATRVFGAFRVLKRVTDTGRGCYAPPDDDGPVEWASFW